MAWPCICSFNHLLIGFIAFKLMFIASLDVQEGSPLEYLMAFHYGHNYKIPWIFGECEGSIAYKTAEEQKALLDHSLFPYPSMPPTPQTPAATCAVGNMARKITRVLG